MTKQSQAAKARGEIIAERLARLGFADCLAGAKSFASGPQVGRPHFARHLVRLAPSAISSRPLNAIWVQARLATLKINGPIPKTVIDWIRDAGGVAVLAHPTKYKLTRSKLIELIADFKAAGGEAMEVISGAQVPSLTRDMARLCRDMGFEASCGSDFHAPTNPGPHWDMLHRYQKIACQSGSAGSKTLSRLQSRIKRTEELAQAFNSCVYLRASRKPVFAIQRLLRPQLRDSCYAYIIILPMENTT